MNDKTRRQLMKALQTESTWLQKALFALGKAEDARSTVMELSEESVGEIEAPASGDAVSLAEFSAVLRERVDEIMEDLQEKRRVTT